MILKTINMNKIIPLILAGAIGGLITLVGNYIIINYANQTKIEYKDNRTNK